MDPRREVGDEGECEKMSERDADIYLESFSLSALKALVSSFKILLRNPILHLSIFALATLPLSLLLFSLSISSRPIESKIYSLEALAIVAPTRFEARQIWKESREETVSLLRYKALFCLPSYVLSLLAAITAVNSTALTYDGKLANFDTAVKAVRLTWKRPLVTSIYVYGITCAYSILWRTLAAVLDTPILKLAVFAVTSVLEVYAMAVLSVGMVVSIVDDRFGLDAIRVGSNLMEGRRFCGWVLSGCLVLISFFIGSELEALIEGQDTSSGWSSFSVSPVMMYGGYKAGLICLFGFVVLWSYIVTTVFYCDCKRWHASRRESELVTV